MWRKAPSPLALTVVTLTGLQIYLKIKGKDITKCVNNNGPFERSAKVFIESLDDTESETEQNNVVKELPNSLQHHDLGLKNQDAFSFNSAENDNEKFICCYKNPQNPEQMGRPFPYTNYIKEHWTKYMKAKPINKKDKKKYKPIPITGASSNHFTEHLSHTDVIYKYFPNQKVVFYDLGLSDAEVECKYERPV